MIEQHESTLILSPFKQYHNVTYELRKVMNLSSDDQMRIIRCEMPYETINIDQDGNIHFIGEYTYPWKAKVKINLLETEIIAPTYEHQLERREYRNTLVGRTLRETKIIDNSDPLYKKYRREIHRAISSYQKEAILINNSDWSLVLCRKIRHYPHCNTVRIDRDLTIEYQRPFCRYDIPSDIYQIYRITKQKLPLSPYFNKDSYGESDMENNEIRLILNNMEISLPFVSDVLDVFDVTGSLNPLVDYLSYPMVRYESAEIAMRNPHQNACKITIHWKKPSNISY
eukprot:Pompholyxophrys_sp_v1_NODE_1_length_32789_cov_6.460653.p14 type:complete len:284 gc:universal NODE_1_length_32789_cov_6.460653:10937-10086(-)